MKKSLHLFRWTSLFVLIAFLNSGLLRAQAVDDFGEFDPPLTETQIVYAKTIFHDGDKNGVFDAAFCLTEVEVVSYGDYSAVVAYYNTGLHIREGGGFKFTNAVIPEDGKIHELWFLINVVDEYYRVWAKREDMETPVLIFDGDADFRRTDISAINYWAAFHNPDAQDDYVEVLEVEVLYSNEAKLDILTFDKGELSPEFSPDILDYELIVPYGTTTLNINANGVGNIVEVWDGVEGIKLPAIGEINIPMEGTDLEIIVISMIDGTESSYMVYIDQGEGRSVAKLQDIETSLPMHGFYIEEDVFDYEVVVPFGTTTFTFNGLSLHPSATVTGDGEVTLSDGKGSATVTVTSADESNTAVYNFTFVEPLVDYAIEMAGGNGKDSHIDISGLNLNSESYTIEMWLKPHGNQSANSGLFYMRESDSNHAGLQYSSDWQGSGAIRFMTNIEGDYGVLTSTVPTDQWHHVAAVLTPDSRTIFFNGTEYAEEDREMPLVDYSSGKLYIGWDDGGDARAFRGMLDEIRVWDKALTLEELNENAYKVLSGNEDNLVGYWNFDIPNPNVAWDLSPAQKHGAIVGGSFGDSFIKANLNMETIVVVDGRIYPEVTPANSEYYILVDEGINQIEIVAEPIDPAVTVSGAGAIDIQNDEGEIVITLTSENGEYNKDYTFKYLIDKLTPELMHSYTFADGTAKDVISGADGVINGGDIVDGKFISSEQGHYIELPAEEISLKDYHAITLEAYVTNNDNPTYTMLAYFGGLSGANSYWIQPTRNLADGDNSSRTEVIGGGATATASGSRALDFANQHFVSVLTYDSICLFIDGNLEAVTHTPENLIIPVISTENAWIGRSGWNDPHWLGEIFEFNIYKGAMTEEEIAIRSLDFPLDDNSSLATLSDIAVDGEELEEFKSYILDYLIELPEGTVEVPTVEAELSYAGASMEINPAESLPGTTTIIVTAEDGVTVNTYTVEFFVEGDPITNIEKADNEGTIVYPTVSKGEFNVKSKNSLSVVSVYNVAGNLVWRTENVANELTVSVPSPGMYIIVTESNNGVEIFKVIKTN